MEIKLKQSKPSFNDWRVSNDAAMVPDKGFTKQLKMLRDTYEVVWDWGSNKWEIWDFPKDGVEPYHVMTVQTQGKEYREVGADILLRLQEGDMSRFTLTELCNYFDEMDNQIRRRRAKDFSALISDIALDSFINIHCKVIQVPREYSIARSVGI